MDEVEKRFLARTLAKHGNNKTSAAKLWASRARAT